MILISIAFLLLIYLIYCYIVWKNTESKFKDIPGYSYFSLIYLLIFKRDDLLLFSVKNLEKNKKFTQLYKIVAGNAVFITLNSPELIKTVYLLF
jgi:hypothetical protein